MSVARSDQCRVSVYRLAYPLVTGSLTRRMEIFMTENLQTVPAQGGVPRRSVAKGAAWTLPVVAIAAAAPVANASTPVQDVVVSASCYGLNIAGIGLSFPQFTITAIGAPIAAGSTFTLSSSGLANVTLGGDTGILDIGILSNGSRVITVKKTIPAGGSATLQITGLLSAQVLKNYTLSVKTIIGNTNSNHGNDSATQTLLGISLFGLIVGYCGQSSSSAKALHKQNLATYEKLTAAQKKTLARKLTTAQ